MTLPSNTLEFVRQRAGFACEFCGITEIEAFNQHFLELNDGMLTALTAVGTFTMRRLRLNRPQLVQHRLHKRQQQELVRVLQQYREQVGLLEQLNQELSRQINEQRELLQTERELLRLLLADDNEEIL